jgi:hypothetical protein
VFANKNTLSTNYFCQACYNTLEQAYKAGSVENEEVGFGEVSEWIE